MRKEYQECIVSSRITPLQVLIRTLSVFGALIVTWLSAFVLGIYSLVVLFFAGYLVYLAFERTSVEYEYQFINGSLTVDKIFGRNRRKQAGEFDLKKMERILPVNDNDAKRYDNPNNQMMMFDYSTGYQDDISYLMIIGHGAGNAKVYFTPSLDMIEAIRAIAPSKVTISPDHKNEQVTETE